MTRIDEVLAKMNMTAAPTPMPGWVDLPPTDELTAVANADGAGQFAQLRLAQGIARDELQATRPEGCWCLGFGGRKMRWYVPAGDTSTPFYGEWCICADGERAHAEVRQAQEKLDRLRQQAAFEQAGVPSRYYGCRLATYPGVLPPQVSTWANRFAEDDLPEAKLSSIFLHGPVGTGKTGVSVGLLWSEISSADGNVLFRGVPALLDAVRASFGKDGPDPMEQAKQAAVLVLDDIGAERITDWVAERLFVLIDHRYGEDLTTIFTSNLNLVDLGKHIGIRAASRIGEMALAVELKGANLRVHRVKT